MMGVRRGLLLSSMGCRVASSSGIADQLRHERGQLTQSLSYFFFSISRRNAEVFTPVDAPR